MAREQRDPYEVLGVARDASAEDVKKAFRAIIRKNHPDRNPGDKAAEERAKEAAEAYDILGNTEKRARFDRMGFAGVGAGGGAAHGYSSFNDIFSAFSDLFGADIFGGVRPGGGRRGASYRILLELDFMEAALGCKKTVAITRNELCEDCQGSGAKKGTAPTSCGDCRGTGVRVLSQGFFQIRQPCPRCGGEGSVISDPCKGCKGEGRVEREKDVEIEVPPGVDDGMQIRVPGEGDHGLNGAPAGDILAVCKVRPHDLFRRLNNDLLLELPVTFAQATLGAEVEIPTLRGKETVKIKAGTQVGTEIRLNGQGFPDPTDPSGRYRKGDLRVLVTIEVPKRLSKRQEELLKEFAELEEKPVNSQPRGFFESVRRIFE